MSGSKISHPPNVYYYFFEDNGGPSAHTTYVRRSLLIEEDEFIKVVTTYYYFIRHKDCFSKMDGRTVKVIYNKHSGRLFIYGKNPKDRSGPKVLKEACVSLYKPISAYLSIEPPLGDKFIQLMIDDTKKRIPSFKLPFGTPIAKDDVKKCIPSFKLPSCAPVVNKIAKADIMFLIVLQRRANKPLNWLTLDVINLFLNTRRPTKRGNIKQALLKGTLKQFTKAFFNKFYGKYIYNLLCVYNKSHEPDIHNPIPDFINYFPFWVLNKQLRTMLQHWISSTLNKAIKEKEYDTLYNLLSLIRNACHNATYITDSPDFITNNDHRHLQTAQATLTQFFLWAYKNPSILYASHLDAYQLWEDMFSMAAQLHIRIRPSKLKSYDDIRSLHDNLSFIINRDRNIIKTYKDVVFERFKLPDKLYSGFEFVQLRTAEDLQHEGTSMHHCVGGYTPRCVKGDSIIISMRKEGKGYVTIELRGQDLKLSQYYTLHDIVVTSEKALKIIEKWYKDVVSLHKNDDKTYKELVINKLEQIVEEKRSQAIKELGIDGPIVEAVTQVVQENGYATT